MSDLIRLSANIKNTGLAMLALGVAGILCSTIPPSLSDLDNSRMEGARSCLAISFLPLIFGAGSLVAYYFFYRVPQGHALVGKDSAIAQDGWQFSLRRPESLLIPLSRTTVDIPDNHGGLIELNTPDSGVIGISLTVTFSCDPRNPEPLMRLNQFEDLERTVRNRTRSAVEQWIRQKPLPGTLKRAMAMKEEAENFVRARLTNVNTADALVIHADPSDYLNDGYPVFDLGIRIHEVHIVSAKPLKNGTGIADWGDGEELAFNAEKIFNQFKGQAGNLSNLRKLKEALIEQFEDEADDIEDIYDQFRMSMKEGAND